MSHALKAAYLAVTTRGQAQGEVRADITSEFAARFLDTQIATALHQVAAGEDPDEVRAQTELALAALLPSSD